MKFINLAIMALSVTGCSLPQYEKEIDLRQLSEEFVDPPMASRPGAYWCWLNGDVTKESLTRDLEEMKAKGMSRAEIWDVAAMFNPDDAFGIGPEFLGDESVELVHHALAEGKRLGLSMGMIASSGWNAGGSWVEPHWASKALYISERTITGPQSFSGALPYPTFPDRSPKNESGLPVFYKEVAVLAIPNNPDKKIHDLSDIVILNDHYDGNVLNWDVPEGDWTIVRFVNSNTGQHLIVPSPKSEGLFIDFFDPQATIKHFEYILGRLGITRENAAESGLDYLEFDSMELAEATPWTDAMDSVFLAHHNYDIIPYLPAFAGWELPNGNDDFLYQWRKTVSDQLIYSHYTTGRDFLAEYGLDLVAEAGGPGPPIWPSCPVDALKALGNVSIPRGEFWKAYWRNIFLVKQIASASNIYGLHLVDAEAFTTWRRWTDSPYDLKKWGDRAFCEGLNMVTIHTFANTRPEHGFPGRSYHAGVDINPTATWWEKAKPFMDYLGRCSHMLRQGKFVADVLYYYGDKAPNFFPELQGDPDKPRLEGLSHGYDFDVVNTDVILNRLETSQGRLVLPDGMSYSLLVLPNREDIPEEVVRKVEKMIADGARVLIQNPAIARNIKGDAFKNISIDEALNRLSITKDFTANPDVFDFIHRRDGDVDIYFVTNTTDQYVSETPAFRATNRQVELWDPVTGKQFVVNDATSKDGKTTMNLYLPPYGSCFVVFSAQRRSLEPYVGLIEGQTTTIEGPWALSFPEGWGAPASATLDDLICWTEHDDEGIIHFSGTATYANSLHVTQEELESNRSFTLDLGEVRDLAEVFINGESAGILWTYPFSLNIKDLLKAGNNNLKVTVTNLWINRLAGDMHLPQEERYTKTNHPFITESFSNWWADEAFRVQRSGMMGPVILIKN